MNNSPKVTRLAAALIAEIMRQAETSGITRFELQKTSVSLCAAKELAAQGHCWVCKDGKIFLNLNKPKHAIMNFTKVSESQYGMMNK